VLLVEDEQIVREPTRRLLARSGYTVLDASNADEALQLLADCTGTIDLLLTDVVMPGRSGKELADEVVVRCPGIKVLFMSGYSQDTIAYQGVVEEGVQLIEKPFAGAALLEKIRAVLDAG
jgi:DNA-binding NtrC family response regulator